MVFTIMSITRTFFVAFFLVATRESGGNAAFVQHTSGLKSMLSLGAKTGFTSNMWKRGASKTTIIAAKYKDCNDAIDFINSSIQMETKDEFGFFAFDALSAASTVSAPPSERKVHDTAVILHKSTIGRLGKACLLSVLFFLSSLLLSPTMAYGADYGSLSAEQKAVAEAWRLIDSSYIDRTFNNQDWFQLRQDNVRNRRYQGMDDARDAIIDITSSLGDKYTRYLSPAKYQSLVDSATGTLAGVGVELSYMEDGKTVYASDVEPNSPANRGGIQPGDVFVEVDGYRPQEDVLVTPDDVALKLRGPEGSKVGVVMERRGNIGKKDTLDLILTRERIKVTSVSSYVMDRSNVGKVGVVKIKSFSGTTPETVSDCLKELRNKGVNALVLDMRNNPGGLLPGGVETASLFLPDNVPVVYVVNKNGVIDSQQTYKEGTDLTTPIVVFVNRNTASAAEVMTAALQENNRALVVGENTFGKGVVQTVKELSNNNGGISVTVAKYETPKRNDINQKGIKVDVVVDSIDDCFRNDAVSCLPTTVFQKARLSAKT